MKDIQEAINNRTETHYGIYHDVGIVMDQFTTSELVEYYLQTNESDLRYYVEQHIIAMVINEELYKK